MESPDRDIDVARTMKKLREEVFEKGEPFDDIDFSSYEINPDFPITCRKPVLGRLNCLTKSLVRKSLRWYIVPIVEQMNEALRAIGEMKTVRRLARLERLSRSLRAQITRLTHERISGEAREVPAESEEPAGLDEFVFQEKFRGDEDSVRERQRVYLDYFEGRQGVLDLGCGRGEFLELLQGNGIGAMGVELDEDMVLLCKEKGLPVERGGALSYLARMPDDALGGVFMAQVVEHLTPRDLGRLVRLCYRKLEPGAPLVTETINPTSKLGMDRFSMDISRTKPLHPAALELLLQSVGFSKTTVQYVNPAPEARKLKSLPPASSFSRRERTLVETFNRNVEILNNELFGYQNCAVIAYK